MLMMGKLRRWLASLFRVEWVWGEMSRGRWMKRRRYHPVAQVFVVVLLLTLGIAGSVYFFSSQPEPGELRGEKGDLPPFKQEAPNLK